MTVSNILIIYITVSTVESDGIKTTKQNLHMLNFKETCSLVFDLLGEKLPHNPYDSVYQMRLRKKKMAGSILYKSFKKCFDC